MGEIARRARVNRSTVRYYERRGLLAEPRRDASGYRRYPTEAVRRIRSIRRAQELGFSLDDIRKLLLLRFSSAATCSDLRAAAEGKLAEIDAKIHSLQRMEGELRKLVAACDGRGGVAECPIVEALEGEGAG